MELGKQIKKLRVQRGVTQETLAERLGVTAQAVSRWERGETLPDVSLLPDLSAYFGVTIDALFALSDDTRMERIQNMIWDEREFDPAAVDAERRFLIEKARREPDGARPCTLLADLENRIADQARARAEEAAKEALRRDPTDRAAYEELNTAMGGVPADWYLTTHGREIDFLKGMIREHPDARAAYLWLFDQLTADRRLTEAKEYLRLYAARWQDRNALHAEGRIEWFAGNREKATELWERMCGTYPDDWQTWALMGDDCAMAGEFERAIAAYENALSLQSAPQYTDTLEATAQICERIGDPARGALALEQELAILGEQWNTVTGETVDRVRREIARLKSKPASTHSEATKSHVVP